MAETTSSSTQQFVNVPVHVKCKSGHFVFFQMGQVPMRVNIMNGKTEVMRYSTDRKEYRWCSVQD